MLYILFCLFLCLMVSCGGSSSGPTTEGDAPSSPVGFSFSKYPGFYENERHDYFFDRHSKTISSYDFEIDDYEKDENGNIAYNEDGSPILKSSKRNVKLDYGNSDLFVEEGETGYVNVYVAWDASQEFDIYENVKFYICDAESKQILDDIQLGENNNNEYQISRIEWNLGHYEKTLEIYSERLNVGLCAQYKDYAAIVYDKFDSHVYGHKYRDVLIAEIGAEKAGRVFDIKSKTKEIFDKASVEVNFQNELYRIPEVYSELDPSGKLEQRHVPTIMANRLFVGLRGKNSRESQCYGKIKDDIQLAVETVGQDLRNGIFGKRALINYNLPMVKFWTFTSQTKELCLDVAIEPEKNGKEYNIGIINPADFCSYEDEQVADNMKMRINDSGYLEIYDNGTWTTDYERFINPNCHILYDENESKDFKYFDAVLEKDDLGVTGQLSDGYKNAQALYAVVKIDDLTQIRTYVHEIGHLLGLSDVEDDDNNKGNYEGNLMHKNNATNGEKLRFRELNLKNASGTEKQWNCLHLGGDNNCGTPSWHKFPGDMDY